MNNYNYKLKYLDDEKMSENRPEIYSYENLSTKSISELKGLCNLHGISLNNVLDKSEIVHSLLNKNVPGDEKKEINLHHSSSGNHDNDKPDRYEEKGSDCLSSSFQENKSEYKGICLQLLLYINLS